VTAVAGVDEVGVEALAGPIIAAAVILAPGAVMSGSPVTHSSVKSQLAAMACQSYDVGLYALMGACYCHARVIDCPVAPRGKRPGRCQAVQREGRSLRCDWPFSASHPLYAHTRASPLRRASLVAAGEVAPTSNWIKLKLLGRDGDFPLAVFRQVPRRRKRPAGRRAGMEGEHWLRPADRMKTLLGQFMADRRKALGSRGKEVAAAVRKPDSKSIPIPYVVERTRGRRI